MRILYDGEVYRTQAAGGVNRYFAELIRRLPSGWTPIVSLTEMPAVHRPEHAALQVEMRPAACPLALLSKWRQRSHFRKLYRQLSADIVHPTYYRLLSAESPARLKSPLVVTVYDMIHERLASQVKRRGRDTTMKRRAIEAAVAIICISESTRRDLLEFYPHVEERISVIHLATQWSPQDAVGDSPEQEAPAASADPNVPSDKLPSAADPAPGSTVDAPGRDPYFVYVGSRAKYKNFDRLLKAIRAVVDRHRNCRLAVVGGPFGHHESRRIAALGLADHVVPYACLPDDQLRTLYRGSEALVYPSLYEGFGIPLLEAMACGTVVVAAASSSIPEVVDDAAILFDPHSTDDLTDILLDLLDHPERRATWIARGRSRAAMFSWQRTAAATMNVYRAVLADGTARGHDYLVPSFSWRSRRQPAA